MDDSRLVKQVYLACKKYTASQKESFCGAIKRLLCNLNLDHFWLSEAIGDLKGWNSFVTATIRRKDANQWLLAVQKKPKLRLYRCLKSELKREDYVEWEIPGTHRSLYARLRSGTHQLRLETGRWLQEPEEDRVCNVCITGKVETEEHFLLDCYVYDRLREGMFLKIREQTGYDLQIWSDDRVWLMDVLLGHGLRRKETRECIGKAVSSFIAVAMRIRKRTLS